MGLAIGSTSFRLSQGGAQSVFAASQGPVILAPFLLAAAFCLPCRAADGNFLWARGMGDSYDQIANSAAVDAAGNVYVAGSFQGTVDFDPGPSTAILTATPYSQNAFLLKLDPLGSFLWVKQLTGGFSGIYSLTLDEAGNLCTTGYFDGTVDFDPGPGTSTLTESDGSIFVLKLSGAGSFVWVKPLRGATGYALGLSIAVDGSGNVFTTGWFGGTVDFDPGAGTANLTALDNQDIFVSKLDSSGNFVWAKHVGSFLYEDGVSLDVDTAGNVYVTGHFQTTVDFDPGPGTAALTSAGAADIYVLKLDAAGGFVWAKRLGGVNSDDVNGIAVAASGAVHLTGGFIGTADFDPGGGTVNLSAVGSIDVFVAKLDESGNLIWARQIGGPSDEYGEYLAMDSSGNVYVSVYFLDTVDFDPGAGVFNLTCDTSNDIGIAKLDSSGGFRWARQLRCNDYTRAPAIAVDNAGGAFTAGYFAGTFEYDTDSGTSSLTAVPGEDLSFSDIYVVKQSGPAPPPSVASVAPADPNPTNAAAVDFAVHFDQSVTGVDSADFAVASTGIMDASITNVSGSNDSYTVTVNTGTGDGTLRLDVLDDDSIVNADTMPLGGTGTGNGSFSAGELYTVDKTPPTVSLASVTNPTNASPVPVAVTFSEPVVGFAAEDVSITNGSVTNFAGANNAYSFGLVPASEGIVTASVAAGVCTDTAGNSNGAASTLSREYDVTQPSVMISSTAISPTNSSPIPVTITFSKDVTGFAQDDIVAINGSISGFVSMSAAVYTLHLYPGGQGEVRLNIAAGASHSAAGNPNLAGSFGIVFDSQPPVITLLGPNPYTTYLDEPFADPGATAWDTIDGDVTDTIVADASAVDTTTLGSYPVVYNVADAAGNAATPVIRNVHVQPRPAGLPLKPWLLTLALCVAGVSALVRVSRRTT